MDIKDYLKQAISIEKAKTLSTRRLLTYYKKYRYIILRTQPKDTEIYWFCGDRVSVEEYQCMKQYFDDIKTILSSREHIPR